MFVGNPYQTMWDFQRAVSTFEGTDFMISTGWIAGLIVSLIKGYTTFNNWLVVWNMNFIYPYIGKNHPKLTNSFIFQRGRSTTNQFHDINISVFCWWKIAIVDGYMCTYLFPTTIMHFSGSYPISHFESNDFPWFFSILQGTCWQTAELVLAHECHLVDANLSTCSRGEESWESSHPSYHLSYM